MMIADPTWREVSNLIASTPGSAESHLPERIRYLRETHRAPDGSPEPLSHTDLARRLVDVGWTTDRTTLWKIENPSAGNGRRKVTIDELIALARALGVTVAELLLPHGALDQLEARTALIAAADALEKVNQAWSEYAMAVDHARGTLRDAVDGDALRSQVQRWSDDLRQAYSKHTVTLWRRWISARIEKGERPEESDLLMNGTDEEIQASDSFDHFRQSVSEQPIFPAYDDILGDRPLAYPRPMARA